MAQYTAPGRSTFNLNLREHLGDPSKKAIYTEALFDEIAHVYDRFALGPISLFQEKGWKRRLVASLPPLPPGPIVDLAAGTGVLTLMAADAYPEREVIGVDISERMLAIAESKQRRANVSFRRMDLGKLTFGDGSVALFTGGYALRNTPHLPSLLADLHRLLVPNGVAAFLDFSKPANPLHRAVNGAALRIWLSLWSLLLHRNLRIYNYIPSSLRYFPDYKALGTLMERTGFEVVKRTRLLFGIAEVLIVRKR